MGEFVEMAGLVGAVTRYYNAAAGQQDAGAVLLLVLAGCAALLTVAMVVKCWLKIRSGRL